MISPKKSLPLLKELLGVEEQTPTNGIIPLDKMARFIEGCKQTGDW